MLLGGLVFFVACTYVYAQVQPFESFVHRTPLFLSTFLGGVFARTPARRMFLLFLAIALLAIALCTVTAETLVPSKAIQSRVMGIFMGLILAAYVLFVGLFHRSDE